MFYNGTFSHLWRVVSGWGSRIRWPGSYSGSSHFLTEWAPGQGLTFLSLRFPVYNRGDNSFCFWERSRVLSKRAFVKKHKNKKWSRALKIRCLRWILFFSFCWNHCYSESLDILSACLPSPRDLSSVGHSTGSFLDSSLEFGPYSPCPPVISHLSLATYNLWNW